MSAVTVGMVAPRAPLSVARLRACVCESERDVGAMKTSHAAKRRGDRRRRLDAVVLALGHDGEHGVGLRGLGLAAQRLPHVLQRLVDDDEHVLARRHGQAVAHDGADGAGESGHLPDATRRARAAGPNVVLC